MHIARHLVLGNEDVMGVSCIYSVKHGLAVKKGETLSAKLVCGRKELAEMSLTLDDAWLVRTSDLAVRRMTKSCAQFAYDVATAAAADVCARAERIVGNS